MESYDYLHFAVKQARTIVVGLVGIAEGVFMHKEIAHLPEAGPDFDKWMADEVASTLLECAFPTEQPLTPKDVVEKAKLLTDISRRFLNGDDRKEAFEQWHDELVKLGKHGFDSLSQVFRELEKQTPNSEILVSADWKDNGSVAQIVIQSSRLARMAGIKHYIGATVDREDLVSAAHDKHGQVYGRTAKLDINEGCRIRSTSGVCVIK